MFVPVICFGTGSSHSSNQTLSVTRPLQPKGASLRPSPGVILPQNGESTFSHSRSKLLGMGHGCLTAGAYIGDSLVLVSAE